MQSKNNDLCEFMCIVNNCCFDFVLSNLPSPFIYDYLIVDI